VRLVDDHLLIRPVYSLPGVYAALRRSSESTPTSSPLR
jgi:hypothetical protein